MRPFGNAAQTRAFGFRSRPSGALAPSLRRRSSLGARSDVQLRWILRVGMPPPPPPTPCGALALRARAPAAPLATRGGQAAPSLSTPSLATLGHLIDNKAASRLRLAGLRLRVPRRRRYQTPPLAALVLRCWSLWG